MAEKIARLEPRVSDATLVVAARAGDDASKEALFRRHAGAAAGLAFRLLGRDGDLEDVVQESFLQAFAKLDRLNAPQAFAAWLAAIVTGQAIAVLRRRRWRQRLGLAKSEPIDVDTLVSKTAPPDVALELRAVYGALDALAPEEHVVLVLRRVEELKLEEIVGRTGWSLATVKRRLTRATAKLEEAMEGSRPSPRRVGE